MFCQNCGVQLAPVAVGLPPPPVPLSDSTLVVRERPEFSQPQGKQPAAVSPQPGSQVNFSPGKLLIRHSKQEVVLQVDKTEYLIGRSDPVRDIYPDIDLALQDGERKGVSRVHARLVLQDRRLFLEDLNSTNYTYLNGQKLVPGRLYEIKPGDEIHLGLLALTYLGT
jgi:pSer/pThr/pTyr-binding forkhead associated (FHA) protein